MTEPQREDDLLAGLLDLSQDSSGSSNIDTPTYHAARAHEPILTRRDEQALLKAANEVGTPTLAPQDFQHEGSDTSMSFGKEMVEVIRRYPIPTLVAGVALAYLLTRRRH
jgi:hypothetical protein